MTMGWMEAIRFLGVDLMVVTVFAVASLDAAARAFKAAWGRIARDATTEAGMQTASAMGSIWVRCRTDRIRPLDDPTAECSTAPYRVL